MIGGWKRHNHPTEKYHVWEMLSSRGWHTEGKLGAELRVSPHLGLRDNVGSLQSGGESGTPPLAVGSRTS